MRRRALAIVTMTLLLAASGTACGKRNDGEEELRLAIRRTERQSRALTYREILPGRDFQQVVLAEIEDDFRYKARLSYQQKDALDEVAYDDALAVRVLDPGALALFLRKDAVQAATPEPGSISAAEALNSGRWVLDEVGAPIAIRTATSKVVIGTDPVRDALTAFAYLEDAISQSRGVSRFNPDSLEPAYKPKEDPFPKPAKGSGVIRYDLVTRGLPSRASSTGGNQAVPGAGSFRKLAVYVDDKGFIKEIREDVDVVTKLDDLARIYDIDFPAGSPDEQAQFAIDVINAVLKGQGTPEIRYRQMQLTLRRVGQSNTVSLPTSDVVAGDLSILRDRGRQAATETGDGGTDVDAATSSGASTDVTTTTAAP